MFPKVNTKIDKINALHEIVARNCFRIPDIFFIVFLSVALRRLNCKTSIQCNRHFSQFRQIIYGCMDVQKKPV